MKFLPLIFKNAFRKKTRTLLMIGSIVLPLLVICIMGTFLRALERPDPGATRGMFRLAVRHKVSLTNFFPRAYIEKIRPLDGVLAITELNWFGGTYIDSSPRNVFPRFAVVPESFLQVFDDATILQGSTGDWLTDRAGCIVGKNLVDKFGWKIGDKVVLKGNMFPVTLELTIRAIYQLPDGNAAALHFNRKYLDEALPPFQGLVGMAWVKARDGEAATRLADQIDRMFENSPYPTKTESEKAFQTSFVAMLGNVKLLVTGIAAVIVFVILLIAANTMAMAARERVTEIAVLRTLGFSKATVLGLVLSESFVIALFGGLLGIGLFVLVEPSMKRELMNSPMVTLAAGMRVFPEILALAFGVSVLIGLLAGVVPAIRSAQRSIVDGLRQVG
jgi:putative ABC transport system permease protein